MNKIIVNSNLFEYEISGKEEPVFIFLSGYDEPLESWVKVRSEMEKLGKVFVYNRLNVGNSGKATRAQCGMTVISDLRELLRLLGIIPPYILIGHSIGGLYINLYGRLYANEVSAAVLIEPTHPDHEARLRRFKPPLHVRFTNGCLDMMEYFFNRNKYTELKSFEKTVQQIESSRSFPDIPLSVISGNEKMLFEPDGLREFHLGNQQELASISSRGRLIVAQNSSHFPQVTQPELVSEVIAQSINEIAYENHG